MTRRPCLPLLALTIGALAACDPPPSGGPVVRTEIREGTGVETPRPAATAALGADTDVENSCRPVIFEDTPFTHCLAVPSRHRIRTVLSGADGVPFRSFERYAAARGSNAPAVSFAVNAGMFDDAGKPIGYFVSEGERLAPLNEGKGAGNFYLQPNGVFFGNDEKWEIRTASDFRANVSERPSFGTQSGPMLVIKGRLHPDVTPDGESRLIRNAVGVDEGGRAHFVISNAPVSFGKLARLFRDKLKVQNALFLDGNVSALWSPATGRRDARAEIGPMLVVEKREDEPAQ